MRNVSQPKSFSLQQMALPSNQDVRSCNGAVSKVISNKELKRNNQVDDDFLLEIIFEKHIEQKQISMKQKVKVMQECN